MARFVFPKGTKAKPGRPAFPIGNRRHGAAALSRAKQKKTRLTRKERAKVKRTVCRIWGDFPSCRRK